MPGGLTPAMATTDEVLHVWTDLCDVRGLAGHGGICWDGAGSGGCMAG